MSGGEEFRTSLKLDTLECSIRQIGNWPIHGFKSSLQDTLLEVWRKLILGGSLTYKYDGLSERHRIAEDNVPCGLELASVYS
jgi:hypothetical protein